jgi:hypothetical protein
MLAPNGERGIESQPRQRLNISMSGTSLEALNHDLESAVPILCGDYSSAFKKQYFSRSALHENRMTRLFLHGFLRFNLLNSMV